MARVEGGLIGGEGAIDSEKKKGQRGTFDEGEQEARPHPYCQLLRVQSANQEVLDGPNLHITCATGTWSVGIKGGENPAERWL